MNILKLGLKNMGSIIIAAIISFFLCISVLNICSAAFTREIGYDAFVYENETATEPIAQYKYLYNDTNGDGVDDGVDTKLKEYEEKGYIVETAKQRSSLSGVGKAVFLGSTQILSAIMIIAFASSNVYKQGSKDSNLIKIGHIKNDKLKGFKIGLIANIPFFIIFVLSVFTASDFRTVLYTSLNAHFYGAITALAGGKDFMSQIGVFKYIIIALMQFIIPAISAVAYILGVKEINLGDRIMYKKEEKQ